MSAQQPQIQQQPTSTAPATTVVVAVKDPVKRDGVLKEQVHSERQAKDYWEEKWSFTKDYYKVCLEEAAKDGLSEEELLKLRITKKGPSVLATDTWKPKPSEKFPGTSSGMVGWRSSRLECSLERVGPMYTSPRHTIDPPDQPPAPPQRFIFLG